MPFYVYNCPSCGRFETQQKITEEPLEQCPICHRGGIHRIIQLAHVIYKSTGFTTTNKRFDPKDE